MSTNERPETCQLLEHIRSILVNWSTDFLEARPVRLYSFMDEFVWLFHCLINICTIHEKTLPNFCVLYLRQFLSNFLCQWFILPCKKSAFQNGANFYRSLYGSVDRADFVPHTWAPRKKSGIYRTLPSHIFVIFWYILNIKVSSYWA